MQSLHRTRRLVIKQRTQVANQLRGLLAEYGIAVRRSISAIRREAAELASEPDRPLLNLTSGYVQRGAGLFPKQGPKAPWVMRQNYILDLLNLRFGKLDDGVLSFSGVALQCPEDLHNGMIAPRTEPH